MSPEYEDCAKCMGTGDDLGGAEEGEKCWACGGSGKERVDDDYVDPERKLGESDGDLDDEGGVWADEAQDFDSYSGAPTTVVIPKHYVDEIHALDYLDAEMIGATLPNGDVEVTMPMRDFDDYLNGICLGDYDSMDDIWASHKPAQVHEGLPSWSHRDHQRSMTKKSSLGEADEFGDFESVVWADQAEELGFDSSSHAPTTVVIPKHYVDNVHALEYLPDGAVEAPLPNGDVEVTLPMWEFDDYLNGICCGDYDSMDAIWASHKPAQVHEGAFSEFSHRDHQRSMGKEECGWCSGDSPSCDHCDGSGYVDAEPATGDTCESCGGAGTVPGSGEYGDRLGPYPCDDCNGTGTKSSNEACQGCNAQVGEHCDPECSIHGAEHPDRMGEGVSFDKFMDRTLLSESKRKTVDEKLSPQRQLARNYQENPLGKTRIGVK